MDAEWVGIAGVAGTLIGTLTTSWIGSRNLKTQLDAQQTEANRQRHYDSTKDRRQPREKAYAEFMTAAQAAMHAITQNYANARNAGSPAMVITSQIDPITLSYKAGMVTIMGPAEVSGAADRFSATLADAANLEYVPGPGGNEPAVLERIARMSTRLDAFAKAAQAALADHGTTDIEQR